MVRVRQERLDFGVTQIAWISIVVKYAFVTHTVAQDPEKMAMPP
jgi:hypothetical protein